LDPRLAGALVTTPRILDGRNVLDAKKWRSEGWTYKGMGRP
jgi:UDPglucose 6-dehydrogenase